MTSVYRVEMFVLGLNNGYESKDQLKSLLENIRHVEFSHVSEIQETDIGEWDDDHPLNRSGHDKVYRSLFPEKYPEQSNRLVDELERMRVAMIDYVRTIEDLNDKVQERDTKLSKYKKLEKIMKDLEELNNE